MCHACDFLQTRSLLSPAANNAKTKKQEKELGILGRILYLAPHDLSGRNVCPMASPGCAAACLFTAGMAGVFASINEARMRRTHFFNCNPDAFVRRLVRELCNLVREAKRKRLRPVVRLNGTADLPWEIVPCTLNGTEYRNVFEAFPSIQFYDYTKVIGRLRKQLPDNYALTFSLSENNDKFAAEALERGFNVAAVIRGAGSTFAGRPVVNGDAHDFRFLDPKGGYVVSLTPKGKAKADTSGFVRDGWDTLHVERKPTFASQKGA